MKLRKILMVSVAVVMALSMVACGDSSNSKSVGETVPSEKVTITFLNSKSGIEKFLEPAFETYYGETGVKIELTSLSGTDSPYEAMQKLYAAGTPPTLALLDANDIVTLGPDYALPLDDENWVAQGGSTYGVSVDDTLYGFPWTLEGRGILFNRTAIEETLGRDFDETSIKCLDDLVAICNELVAAGMEYPTVVNPPDWSLGAHYMGLVYEQQGTPEDVTESADAFIASLKDGSANMADNDRFNSLMDTFDVLKKYNLYGADPLGTDYDTVNLSFIEGETAFYFNGNWIWDTSGEFAPENAEFGMLPVVQNNQSDVFNTLCNAVGSKQIMINKSAGDVEIQAAKDLLNWLVNDEVAQNMIAEQLMGVPAFTTYAASENNRLGGALKKYVDAGKTFPQYNGLPGDHYTSVGASMQKYLTGQCTREELASEIDAYWQAQ